nr:hypothetical protein [Oceanococcus sp. HetDA_MAG_MS8]
MNTPAFLKDANDLLGEQGFAVSHVWYHGTSSELVASIQEHGLKRSGDQALQAATQKTMATLQHEYQATQEPVFLSQSKELAFYWAAKKARERQLRLGGKDKPVVFAVDLPAELSSQVKPDVGAASLLLLKDGEEYMAHLAGIYQDNNAGVPDIDLRKADRMEYLTTLGMAYFDDDIGAAYLRLLSE